MTPDLYWISGPWRGRLAIAARPRGGEWLEEEISSWRRAGINVVVSTLEQKESLELDLTAEPKIAETKGVGFIAFPIPDRGIPASVSESRSWMADLCAILNEGKNVAIHCRQGIGRSGMIAAGALALSGLRPEKAIQVVSAARGFPVPETREQREWIQQLASKPSVLAR